MKAKNTYSRKPIKKGRLGKQNVINYNIQQNFITQNIINVFVNNSQENKSKPQSSKSESGSTFDQLLKGPIFNQPQSSFSEDSGRFFRKRQDTATFYKSDAELSTSSSISRLLFKDSKDSDIYSPSLLSSPSEYRQVKNKFFKIRKEIKLENNKKISKGVQKKRAVGSRKKPPSKPAKCASSTPSGPKALLGKANVWVESCVSPIIPPQGTPATSVSVGEGNKKTAEPSSGLDISALVKGLGNLGFRTPHCKKRFEVKTELFNYESPARVVVERDGSTTDTIHMQFRGVENCTEMLLELENDVGLPKMLKNVDLSKSAEEISYCNLGVSTSHQNKFEEEEKYGRLRPQQLISKSLDEKNSRSYIISSPTDSEHVLANEGLLGSKQLSQVLPNDSTSELKNETDSLSTSLNSFVGNNSDSSSEMKLKPVSIMTENTEKHSENNNLDSLLPEDNSSQQSLEEAVKSTRQPLEEAVKSSQQSLEEMFKSSRHYLEEAVLMQEPNDSVVSINLEAGKRWRRSFLRQKTSEGKFESKRCTLMPDTLVKMIRESSMISSLRNTTTCSNMTGIIDSLMGDQELRNESLPEINISLSKLRNVYTKRRINYVCNMNEIPEDICDNSDDGILNETELCEQEPVVEETQEEAYVNKNDNDTNIDRSNIFDTPPILKENPEALSAITDRKRTQRFRPRSMDECSIYSDIDETNEKEEENDFFTSCCSKLEDDVENLDDVDIQKMGRVGFLLQVGQPEGPKPFAEVFPDGLLKSGGCQKIGEGVFGEVFVLNRPEAGKSVIKIIPIEGSQLVNNEHQKRFDEVLSELIITEELSMLRRGTTSFTSVFCELRGKFFLQGEYPAQLLQLWHQFDAEKRSENECPEMFGEDQLYLALEMAHAGDPVENCPFRSPQQALAGFLQTTFALAVGESALEFEHRDLHMGNLLVQKTSEKFIPFKLNGLSFDCPTYGSTVTIIDCTLSRISFKGDVLYFDLENDPELFTASGDYQFDIYRDMRADLHNDWRMYQAKTNVRWLHYLIDKLTGKKFKYKQNKKTKAFRENMEKLVRLKEMILDFYSAFDLASHLIHSYSQTMSLLRLTS